MMNYPDQGHLTPYGTFSNEFATEKDDYAPRFLGKAGHEETKQQYAKAEYDTHTGPRNSYSNDSYSESDAEKYPSEVTISGSTKLPEVESDLTTKKKKKRPPKIKSPVVAPLITEHGQLVGQQEQAKSSEEGTAETVVDENPLHTPEYKKPTILPPITTKSTSLAATSATPVIPAIGQASRPEPVGEEMTNLTEGATNDSYVNETSFVSRDKKKDGTDAIQKKLVKDVRNENSVEVFRNEGYLIVVDTKHYLRLSDGSYAREYEDV